MTSLLSPTTPPLIGIPGCFRTMADAGFHMAADEYVRAIAEAVQGIPVILPALEGLALDALLARLDGILVTGSASNVDPIRYGGISSDPGTLHDPARDASNLALLPAAVAAGVPLLAICRGFQEMNVAYGGTLHQKVHEIPGRMDHRADPAAPTDVQYGPRHAVRLTEGGMLRRLLESEFATVNSLHWQGVDRLGDGLVVEAVADDGTVEAFRVRSASAFAFAVQWHPEYRPAENPVSRAIFAAFADAVRLRQLRPTSSVAA